MQQHIVGTSGSAKNCRICRIFRAWSKSEFENSREKNYEQTGRFFHSPCSQNKHIHTQLNAEKGKTLGLEQGHSQGVVLRVQMLASPEINIENLISLKSVFSL